MRKTPFVVSILLLQTVLIAANNQQKSGTQSSEYFQASHPAKTENQIPPDFGKEVARVEAEIDTLENDTLAQMARTTQDRQGQLRTLGRLLLFDKHLSVHENEACSFCHTPETGFTARFSL